MVELSEVIAFFLRFHNNKIVHYNDYYFCYDTDIHHFMWRYVTEDDHCWRICEDLDLALRNYLILNE